MPIYVVTVEETTFNVYEQEFEARDEDEAQQLAEAALSVGLDEGWTRRWDKSSTGIVHVALRAPAPVMRGGPLSARPIDASTSDAAAGLEPGHASGLGSAPE